MSAAVQTVAAMRKANNGAAYRVRNAMRVNPGMNFASSSGEAKQRKAIRLEIAKSKAVTHTNE